MVSIPQTLAQFLTAGISDQLADDGTILVLGLAVGIPLAFYVIHQLIGLLPEARRYRNKYGDWWGSGVV